jgi:hypothetical protein
MKRVKVTPVVAQTSVKIGDLVRARFILGGASDAVADMDKEERLAVVKAGLPLLGATTRAWVVVNNTAQKEMKFETFIL